MTKQSKFWLNGSVLFCILVLSVQAFAAQDQKKHPNCQYCGMDRAKFAHSRICIKYDDSSSVGVCSLHCAATDLLLKIDRIPINFQVADFNTKELIDAPRAFWVVGGSKPGVMTRRAKWAFGNRSAAEAFVKQFGGEVSDFDTATQAAYDDMYQDLIMIRAKRQMLRGKQGS